MSEPAARETTPTPEAAEIRWGSRWLGRVGIAFVLAGLVFFARWAPHGSASPWGRAATLFLLYAASAVVFALGLWLGRKRGSDDATSLVLVAGALAAVYYTTYAAHYVPSLQVVRSPGLATGLLLACAGLMVFAADRRQSRALGLLAVVLALYAGLISIGTVASFALVSNAVLALAAFVFLVRNGWSTLSLAFVAATYLTFGYWHLYREGRLVFPFYLSIAEFWRSAGTVFVFWSLFSVPTLRSTDEADGGSARSLLPPSRCG